MIAHVGVVGAVAVTLVSCGRRHFDPVFDGARGDGDVPGDLLADRPNVAFITNATSPGDFGGSAVADGTCQTAATSRGIGGNFIALLSTSMSNAIDRLAGSRGWIRTDGQPIVDQPRDLLTDGKMFNLIDHTEAGVRLPLVAVFVWTGTEDNGVFDVIDGSCSDWSTQTGTGAIGFFDRSAPFELKTASSPCNQDAHFYCFETGHAAPVSPIVTQGKLAFVSTPTSQGLGMFDAQCQADAMAAGLPAGTYLAAVATTTASIASRFPGVSEPFRRPDGTQVSTTGPSLFDSELLSPVNQRADGTYLANAFAIPIATGAPDPRVVGTLTGTCDDWTAVAGAGEAGTPIDARPAEFWGGTAVNCNTAIQVLCLQQ